MMSARSCFQHTEEQGVSQGVWQGEVQGASCHGILGQEGEEHRSRNLVLEAQVCQHGHLLLLEHREGWVVLRLALLEYREGCLEVCQMRLALLEYREGWVALGQVPEH